MTPEAVTDVRGDALQLLSSGLYVLTACAADTVHAAAVSWVSQVSLQPPLVLVALRRNSLLAHSVGSSPGDRVPAGISQMVPPTACRY